MAAVPHERLTVTLREAASGRWTVTALDRSWTTLPDWPSDAAMARFGWLAEDGDLSADMGDHARETEAQAKALGEALWASIAAPAPWRIRRRLAKAALTVRFSGADPRRLAALALLRRRDDGWLGRPPHCLSAMAEEKGPAADGAPGTAPLRVLLATARLRGADDAPYCLVALPLARALGRAGLRLERVAPRLGAIRERLATARAEGRPYGILVYDGHGGADANSGRITLESRLSTAMVGAEQFAAALGDPAPALVLLAACRSARAVDGAGTSSGFATALAEHAGAEVVGMHHNIPPRATAALVARLVERLGEGLELEDAVAEARQALAEEFDGLVWSGPVHHRAGPLQFRAEPTAGPPAAIPDGIPRHLDCAAVDRGFSEKPAALLVGPPLVGKTHFLAFYRWWRTTLAGTPGAQLALSAHGYGTPDAFLAAHRTALAETDLVTIDDADHWMRLPAEAWERLSEAIRAGDERGTRWLVASRAAAPAGLPADLFTAHWLLWPGGGGLRDDLDLAELMTLYFGPEDRSDPWLRLLLVALRCEPVLLEWAGESFREGIPAATLLERYVFADAGLVAWLQARLPAAAGLDRVDPMLGWAFGQGGEHLLSYLATPEEAWEEPARKEAIASAFAAFEAAGTEGLATRLAGVQWLMSPAHAVLLRARAPLHGWPAEWRTRLARHMTFLEAAYELHDSDMTRTVAAARRRDDGTLAAGPINEHAMFWSELFLQTPVAFAAARVAVETGLARELGDIAAGLGRVCMEFDAFDSCRAWLQLWADALEGMPDDSPGLARGRTSLAEELERVDLFTGQQSMAARTRSKLAAYLDDDGGPLDIPDMLERIAASFDSGADAARAGNLDQLTSNLTALVGPQLADDRSVAALARLAGIAEQAGAPGDHVRLLVLQAYSAFHRHAFDEVRALLARAEELVRPLSTHERYMFAATAIELLSGTGDQVLISRARDCLALARELGAPLEIGNALLALANAHSARGELQEARTLAMEALAKLDNVPLFRATALLILARIERFRQDVDTAESYRAKAEAVAVAIDHVGLRNEALALAPILAWQAGAFDRVETEARRLLEASTASGYTHGAGIAHWMLAETSLQRGDAAAAEENARLALDRLRPSHVEGYQAYALEVLAKASFALDRYGEAYAAQREAAGLYEAFATDSSETASIWAVAESFAVMIESREGADEANARIEAIAPDYQREPHVLAVTAAGWAQWGELDRARHRALQALGDADELPPGYVRMLREIVDFTDSG